MTRTTPGEFVLRKPAAQIIGPSMLHELNRVSSKKDIDSLGTRKFQGGGLITRVPGIGIDTLDFIPENRKSRLAKSRKKKNEEEVKELQS